MDQLWYYEDHGRAKGPVTTADLVQKIKAGEITLVDLVFKDGEHQWMPIQSYDELTELIGNVTLQDTSEWIVLKTVNVDGKTVSEQLGPFNAVQILDLLDRGKIRFSDYVWRTGYEKWVPLGRVDEFEKPLKSSIAVDKSLYEKPRHYDLLSKAESVAKEAPLKRVTPIGVKTLDAELDELKPEEARGEDLTAPSWKIKTTVVNKTEVIHSSSKEPVENTAVVFAPPAKAQAPVADEMPTNKYALSDEKTPPPMSMPSSQPLRELEARLNKQPLEVRQESPLNSSVEKLATGSGTEDAAESDEVTSGNHSPSKFKEGAAAVTGSAKTVMNKMWQKAQTLKPQAKIKEATPQEEVSEAIIAPEEHKHKMQRRFMQAGVAACVLVIIFVLTAMMSLGKKKLDARPRDEFSIKMGTPSAEVQQKVDAAKAEITPKVESVPQVTVEKKPEVVVEKSKVEKETKTLASTHKKEDSKPTIGGSFKNKSYYHHKERIYLFYSSNEGERLAADLQKASNKHQKSSKNWKNFYGGWKGRAKNYSSKVSKEAKKARLHRKLFNQLATSASDLEDIGRDIDAQMSKGRGPSRVASAKSVESQFKSIRNNARSLDR